MNTRTLGFERLEDRSTMDATASNILWEPTPLSADNESAVLPNATARSFSMDVALPDASRLARGLQNGNVEIYDTSTGALIHTIPSQGQYASQIEVSPDGTILAVGTGAPSVRLFDARSYAEIGGFAMPGFVYSIVFRGNEIFASTWEGGPTTVYDVRTRAVRTIGGASNHLDYLASIDDRFYAYDARGVLKELDPASGQVLRSVNIAGGSRIDASSESGIIAMGTTEGNVVIFDENLNQLGAFHPGMGAIQHVGFDASGTRLTARSDAGGVVFIDLSTVRAGGMMTEAGRTPAGDSAAYEVGMPMTPDGTVAFVHEANGVTALKTPWEPLPPPSPEGRSEPGENGIPPEVTDLIGEAVMLARNGTPWRTPEAGEIVSSSSAKATRVQLVPRAGEVVAFTANVFPTTSVTAHAYKGTEKIWSGAVPSDGVFSYENAEGITEVLFTSNVTTYVSNVSIVTDEAVDVPPYALTPMNSAEFAMFAARPIAQPANMSAAAQRLDIRGAMSGTGKSESRVLLNRDQNNYTLLRMNVSSGNSRIFDVKAIRLKGLDYRQREEVEFVGLQDGFLERIDDRTWIVAPGMPATLVATLGFYQKSTYSIQVVNGLSREAIMPLLTMGKNTIDIDLLTMNDQFRTEGVFPGMTDVPQGESPVFAKAGHRLNATYNIRNEALNGGTVGFDVYVGWYAGEPTRGTLQKTFSFPLGGGETKMVSVNVTAPPKPADATSDRPIIHTVARLPNGESAVHARLGKAQKGETRVITNKEGGGLNISYVSREYTAREQERIRYLTDRALNALLTSSDDRLVAVRDALGDDHIVQLLAESSAAALGAASTTTDEEATDMAVELVAAELEEGIENDAEDLFHDREGVGGSEDLPPNTEKLLTRGIQDGEYSSETIEAAGIVGMRTPSSIYNEALSWSVPIGHALSDDFSGFDSSTIAGRMLTAGVMQMHSNRGNERAQWETAFMIQAVTDIPAEMLMDVANAGSDIVVTRKFKALLETAQYKHLTSPNTAPATPAIVMAVTNKPTYQAGDQQIRIRFDVAGTASGVKSVQIFEGATLLSGARGIGFITVPIIALPSKISGLGVEPEFTAYTLRLRVVLEDGTVVEQNAKTFLIETYLPDNLRNPPILNEGGNESLADITALIRDHFPLGNAVNYYMYLGSSYHDGNEYYAADLNSLGGTDTDRGHVMKAIASGTIRFGASDSYSGDEVKDLKLGVIVIDHGEGLQSGYMHMPIFKGVIKPHPTTGSMVQHYEVRQQEPIYTMLNGAQKITGMRFTGNIIEFYDGMPIEQGSPTGYVGGRNGGSEDAGYYEGLNNAHAHFFVKKNGASVNLWPGLSAAGMTVVKAYDTGPDGIPDTPGENSDEYTINVRFDSILNAWVNDALKLVVNRSNQESLSPGVQTGQYFMAWEGANIATMKKVVWDKDAQGWFELSDAGSYALVNGRRMKWAFFENIWQFIQE